MGRTNFPQGFAKQRAEVEEMKILVLNCGSSSIKYEVFKNEKSLTSGLIEKIGEKGSKIKNHEQGVKLMLEKLENTGIIVSEIAAVGHRVVHGGLFSKSCKIDKNVIHVLEKYSKLAPLHNPVNLKGIKAMQKILPKVPHVAVFDTAFHQTIPEHAYMYAIPYELYKKEGIRRYGFHGTSINYVAQRAAKILKKPMNKLKMIVCHLGAGCSICAVDKGKSVETSMGFTPLEGLIMGTRCGDVDPSLSWHLEKHGMKIDDIYDMLNKKSGLLGVSGISKDMRDLIKSMKKGNKRAKLALQMFAYRLKKYIGAYAAVLGNVDAIVFTAGIGEHVPFIRSWACDIPCLNIKIDEKKNKKAYAKEMIISANDSRVKVLVVPTNEEKMIAIETQRVIR